MDRKQIAVNFRSFNMVNQYLFCFGVEFCGNILTDENELYVNLKTRKKSGNRSSFDMFKSQILPSTTNKDIKLHNISSEKFLHNV